MKSGIWIAPISPITMQFDSLCQKLLELETLRNQIQRNLSEFPQAAAILMALDSIHSEVLKQRAALEAIYESKESEPHPTP